MKSVEFVLNYFIIIKQHSLYNKIHTLLNKNLIKQLDAGLLI